MPAPGPTPSSVTITGRLQSSIPAATPAVPEGPAPALAEKYANCLPSEDIFSAFDAWKLIVPPAPIPTDPPPPAVSVVPTPTGIPFFSRTTPQNCPQIRSLGPFPPRKGLHHPRAVQKAVPLAASRRLNCLSLRRLVASRSLLHRMQFGLPDHVVLELRLERRAR